MIGTARIIEDDLFGIAARLKSVDESYFIVRNYKMKRFEVHSSAQRRGSLALVLPFETLDERTFNLVLKTRAHRRAELIRQIEEDNARLDKERIDKRLKETEKEVEKIYGKL